MTVRSLADPAPPGAANGCHVQRAAWPAGVEPTTDLPLTPATKGKDLLVVEEHGGKYVRDGRWSVPARIELVGTLVHAKVIERRR